MKTNPNVKENQRGFTENDEGSIKEFIELGKVKEPNPEIGRTSHNVRGSLIGGAVDIDKGVG